jgi:general secretion pathway protein F
MPLAESLQVYAGDVTGPFADGVAAVAERMAGGSSLTNAVENDSKNFHPMFVAYVRVGEEGNLLPEMMARFASIAVEAQGTANRAVGAMAQPAMNAVIQMLCLCVMAFTVLPVIYEALPGPPNLQPITTKVIYAFIIVCPVSALILGVVMVCHLDSYAAGALKRSRFMRLLSRLLGCRKGGWSLGVFCDVLATCLQAGIPSVQALKFGAEAAASGPGDDAFARMVESVSEGEKMSSAIIRELGLQENEAWYLSAADGSEALPNAFREIAWRSIERAGRYADILCEVVSAVFVVLSGLVVLLIGLSFFLPLITLMNSYGI